MIRKAFALIGALALVLASAVPAQARPGPPVPSRPERCSVPVEIPERTKIRTCPDGQVAVYSWDTTAGWVLVYAVIPGNR